jgi:hypothetical protein
MLLVKRILIYLALTCAFYALWAVNGVASVVGDPQYYVRAVIVDVEPDRGGLHTLRVMIEGLVENQAIYGGYHSPGALPMEVSTEEPHALQITLDPRVSVKPGDTIVVGVIHGSSMGERGPVPWIMLAQPYLEDGTPIGLFYGALDANNQ